MIPYIPVDNKPSKELRKEKQVIIQILESYPPSGILGFFVRRKLEKRLNKINTELRERMYGI